MKKMIVYSLLLGHVVFYACSDVKEKETICRANLKDASSLAYNNPENNAFLDSALTMVNKSMECDSTLIAATDLKIKLLITMGKFEEGARFVDSLKQSAFLFPYQKKLNYDNFVALHYTSNKDTVNRDKKYRMMISDLEKQLHNKIKNTREFEEVFLALCAMKENISDTIQNSEIDVLILKYPNQAKFLEFNKK